MTESPVTNINMPSVPLDQFYQMKAQLNAQDREFAAMREELKEVRSDIKALLAIANRGKGAVWMAVSLGGLFGGVIAVIVEVLFRHR